MPVRDVRGKAYSLNVNQWAALIIDELSSKLCALLRVGTHDVLQKADKVRAVADLLRVQNNFVRLTGLSETCDDLIGDICAQVHTEREGQVVQANYIPKLFTAGKLQICQPMNAT